MYDDEKSRSWLAALKQCDFAGQIDLTENELNELAPAVQRGFDHFVANDLDHPARIVFAVNCAYYALDEGFWDYCCRLLKRENTPQVQTHLGRRIEESLMRFDFLEEARYGPFRCVGPILEQTGVTRRSIPKFARVLQECRETNWEEMLALTFPGFIAIVETLQPGTYLGYFLKSDSKGGWEFTRAVARSLAQYERGLISWKDLQTLPGYRPGFWKELKTHVDLDKPAWGHPRQERAPMPRLDFDPSFAQVQISFDHDWVERRAYTFEGEVVEASKQHLTLRAQFKQSYDVYIGGEDKTTKKVKFRGWALDQSDPVAIFHPQKGYIPTDTPVPLGRCYLLAPSAKSLPSSVLPLTDFEHVSITDAQYVFWQVEITAETDLKEFGYVQQRKAVDILTWANDFQRFPASIESIEMFVNQLPLLRVKSAELFRQNRLALFLEVGTIVQRMHVLGTGDTFEIELPVKAPSIGRVWVEPLGRLREGDSGYGDSKLDFALLPEIEYKLPSGLYAPQEQPMISIEGDSGLAISFPNCMQIAAGNWRVPAESRFIEGNLHIPPHTLLLAWTIHRAEFNREADSQQRCFELSEFDSDFQLRLCGLPDSSIQIGVFNALNTNGFDLAQTFDAAGRKRISSFSVRDNFKNYAEPAGTIVVWDGNNWVHSGAALINLTALRDWLLAETKDESPPWLQCIDTSLREWIGEVQQSLSAKNSVRRFQNLRTLPFETQTWADEIWLMLLVFRESTPGEADPLPSDQTVALNQEMIRTLRWVHSARLLIENGQSVGDSDGSALLEEHKALQWRPPKGPWVEIAQNLLQKLQQLLDLDAMISEWAAEATPPIRNVFRSRIASQRRGSELTEAYICSQQGNPKSAYGLADRAEHETDSGLVRDLALLLKNIVRFRSNLVLELPPGTVHKKLQPFFAGISELAHGREATILTEGVTRRSEVLDPRRLPLHQDDIALLCRAIGIPSARHRSLTINT